MTTYAITATTVALLAITFLAIVLADYRAMFTREQRLVVEVARLKRLIHPSTRPVRPAPLSVVCLPDEGDVDGWADVARLFADVPVPYVPAEADPFIASLVQESMERGLRVIDGGEGA